jgi:crotonobetainyl-CoA:carnitine CoA-transferase CaiB-like acyl-CoA transferase
MGPLAGIKVIDLSRVLAGPWAAQSLADLGAHVIKVERPGKGDDSRAFGPPWLKDSGGADTREAGYFLCANRGKESVTVDIAKPQGAAIVRALAERADVLIENYKVGDLARYGLGYEDLRSLNPGLIYCSVTGFGQTGPYRDRPGYDFMVQGLGGMMSITGERDDRPGGGPQRVGVPVVDLITGLYATIAINAALHYRNTSGHGQHIDMALLDCCVAFLANQGANYLVTGTAPGRLGNDHPNIVPYQTVRTADGNIILAVGNDNLFRKFCDVAGCPELVSDPRFATNAARVENRAAIQAPIAAAIKRRTTAEWIEALDRAGVPCAPINDLAQVFADPQVIARGLRVEIPHASGARAPLVRSPMVYSESDLEFRTPPPTLGQHTEQVLRQQLGYAEAEIAELRAQGVI